MKGNKGGKPCAGRGNEIESRDLILLKRSISEFRQPNTDRTGGGGRILEKKELHRYSKGPPQVSVEY